MTSSDILGFLTVILLFIAAVGSALELIPLPEPLKVEIWYYFCVAATFYLAKIMASSKAESGR